ncbi:MAG: TlpA family protein disulfide reductase [Bacteroidota bacterium]
MKYLVSLVFSIVISLFLISCTKNEPIICLDQKVRPIFQNNDKFSSLIQDSISELKKTPFSTYDAQFEDYTNRMTVKPINIRAANYKDEFSRFQIVQYDDDFNGIFSDSTDKIFINTFENKYLHTFQSRSRNSIQYKEEFIVNISYLYYKVRFLNDDQIQIKRIQQQPADLIFYDRISNIEILTERENKIDFYDILLKDNLYVYHMAYDCKPCLISIPEINKFKEKNPNVKIVGLVTRDKEQQHLDKLNKLTKNWEVFGISNPNNHHQKIFRGLPEMILIDDKGYYLSKSTWIK